MPDADYFSDADDESAVALIEAGGPARAGLDVIFLKDIDPVDAIAQLEAIMTGCSYEEASQRPRSGQLLSSIVEALVGLAKRARAGGLRLYCWLTL